MTTLLSRYHDLYIVAVSYGSARTVTVIFFFFFFNVKRRAIAHRGLILSLDLRNGSG